MPTQIYSAKEKHSRFQHVACSGGCGATSWTDLSEVTCDTCLAKPKPAGAKGQK